MLKSVTKSKHLKKLKRIVGGLAIPSFASIFFVYIGLDIILDGNPFLIVATGGEMFNEIVLSGSALISITSLYLIMLFILISTGVSSFLILDPKCAMSMPAKPRSLKQWIRRVEYIFWALATVNVAVIILCTGNLLQCYFEENPPMIFHSNLRLSFLSYYILLGCISSLHAYIGCGTLYTHILRYSKSK